MRKSMKNTLIAALVMISFILPACADSNGDQTSVVPQQSLLQKAANAMHSIPGNIERQMLAAVIERKNSCSICRFGEKTGDFVHVYPPKKTETALGYTVVTYRVSIESTTYFYADGKHAKAGQSYPGRTHATFAVLWDDDVPHLVYQNVFESYVLQDLESNVFPGIHQEIADSKKIGYALPDANSIAAAYVRKAGAVASLR